MSWQYIGQSVALDVQTVSRNTLKSRSYISLYLNVAKNEENQSTAVLDLNQKQMKEQFWATEQVRTIQMADRRWKIVIQAVIRV